MRSHTVNSTAAAARYQANSKIIPASPSSHRDTHPKPTPACAHTHSHTYKWREKSISMHKYAHTRLHTHTHTQVSAAAVIFLQITAVILEEGSYSQNECEREVFVLILCSSVLNKARERVSQWEKASCKVLCCVTASPESRCHHCRRQAIYTSLTMPLAESFSAFRTMKNCVCLTSGSRDRLIFLLLKNTAANR